MCWGQEETARLSASIYSLLTANFLSLVATSLPTLTVCGSASASPPEYTKIPPVQLFLLQLSSYVYFIWDCSIIVPPVPAEELRNHFSRPLSCSSTPFPQAGSAPDSHLCVCLPSPSFLLNPVSILSLWHIHFHKWCSCITP